MSPRRIAFIAILISSLLWATAGVTAKILLRSFEPFPLAFWRFFFAAIVLIPFLFKQKDFRFRSLRDILPITLLSTGNITLFYFALTRTTANAAAIIYTGTPLLAAILAKYTIKESLPSRKVAGIMLGLVGVVLITILPVLEKGQRISGDTVGNLIVFVASFCWAGYTVGSRHLITRKGYSPIAITIASIFLSAAIFFIMSLLTATKDFISPLLNPTTVLLILHLAILVTVATYLLHQWAIKYSSATTATLVNYTSTVFAVLLGIGVLGESFTAGFAVGSVIVFGGIFLYSGNLFKEFTKKLLSLGR